MSESRAVYGDAPEFAIRQLDLDLTDAEAMALAHLINRIGQSECLSNTVDDVEARATRAAISRLQSALAREGYAPRKSPSG